MPLRVLSLSLTNPSSLTMRICLISRAPFLGGAEVACERLAIGLSAACHEVVVLLGLENDVAERFRAAGIDVRVFATPQRDKWHLARYLWACQRLRRFFQAWKPDIIHSNDLPTHQIVSSAARGLGIPRICHHRFVYDGTAIDWMNSQRAEHHLFVSQYLQHELRAQSSKLASEPSSVLYDGLEIPPAPPTREDKMRSRVHLGLPLGKVLVLFAGQLVERKGVADLLHAWSQLSEESHQRSELVIVGDDIQNRGDYRKKMEHLSRDLGISPNFAGFRRDIPEWLKASDVAVVPSHVEPLGNATLEAMSYGLPVIGSRVGGIPEMIVNGETGWLCQPKDAASLADCLNEAICNVERRSELGLSSRRRCEAVFSLKSHISAAVQVYESLASRHNCEKPSDTGKMSNLTTATPSLR